LLFLHRPDLAAQCGCILARLAGFFARLIKLRLQLGRELDCSPS